MRVPVDELRTDAALFQQLLHPRGSFRFCLINTVRLQRLRHNISNGPAGVQRSVRVLKNDLHLPAQQAEFLRFHLLDILSVKNDRSGCGFDQIQDQPTQRGLAATGFANQGQSFTLVNIQIHICDGVDNIFTGFPCGGGYFKFFGKALCLDQFFLRHFS